MRRGRVVKLTDYVRNFTLQWARVATDNQPDMDHVQFHMTSSAHGGAGQPFRLMMRVPLQDVLIEFGRTVRPTIDESKRNAFLALWTKAVGTPDYVKGEWKALEKALFPTLHED